MYGIGLGEEDFEFLVCRAVGGKAVIRKGCPPVLLPLFPDAQDGIAEVSGQHDSMPQEPGVIQAVI